MARIDARGISCPLPVLLTKKGLDENPEGIEIIVDNTTAKGNIERFVKNAGYQMEIIEDSDDFVLKVSR